MTMKTGRTTMFPKPIQREYDWAWTQYGRLAKRYPNQWVAFAHRRVLAAGPRLNRVLEKAHRLIDWPEIPHLFVESGVHFYHHAYRP